MSSKYISIPEIEYNKILNKISNLISVCCDEDTKSRLEEVLVLMNDIQKDFTENETENETEGLILKLLNATKRERSDLNVRLYILYQDLKRGKITEECAMGIYEEINRQFEYDKMIKNYTNK